MLHAGVQLRLRVVDFFRRIYLQYPSCTVEETVRAWSGAFFLHCTEKRFAEFFISFGAKTVMSSLLCY
jgi:hypothetical protein